MSSSFREKLRRGVFTVSSKAIGRILPVVEVNEDGFFGGDLKVADDNAFLLKDSRQTNKKCQGFVR